jgi:DNA-binding NarL/FixJ family response regulator
MDNKPFIRVLLVDDYPLLRDTLARVIHSFPDMEIVAQASNGLEAIDAYRGHQPDVTLMDIAMPELDGVEATRLICQQFPQARIILLSALDEKKQYEKEAAAAGAVAVVGKDVSIKELERTIREIYNHAGPQINENRTSLLVMKVLS